MRNVTELMGRNRLEIINNKLRAIAALKFVCLVVYIRLSSHINKCNYREYIKRGCRG